MFIGTYYGKQENAPLDEIEMEYAHFRTQINTLSKHGMIILTGDFNAKIAINKTTVSQQQSNGGKHLQGLINDLQLQTVSIISPTGAWTWVKRNN